MNFLKFLDKVDDIIYEPTKLICDWVREPLNSIQDKRKAKIAAESEERQLRTEIIKNEHSFELSKREKELQTKLHVERETGVARVIAEIDQWKKNQELERFKEIKEAVINYRERLTRLNVEAFRSIGNMQIDLYERAQNLILEKTNQYRFIQSEAMKEAKEETRGILTDFSNNAQAMDILLKGVESKLTGIIRHAIKFIDDLSQDMKRINDQIILLTDRANASIEAQTQKQLEYLAGPNNRMDIIDAEIVQIKAN